MRVCDAAFASRIARTQFRHQSRTHVTATKPASSSISSGGTSGSGKSSSGGSGGREGWPLAAWLGPAGLQLMEQQYSVAGRVLRMVAPLDVDAVMDSYINTGIDGDPYWARVWPSAICLAEQLLQRPELVAGKTVADLGAGLGVAGIAAALAGAAEVVLLDREPLALQCGLVSAAASGVAGVAGLSSLQVHWSNPAAAAGTGSDGSSSSSSSSSRQAPPPAAEVLQLAELYAQQRSQQQQQQQQVLPGSSPAASGPAPPAAHVSSSGSSEALQRLLQQQHHQEQQEQQQQPQPPCGTSFRAAAFDWSVEPAPDILRRFDVVLACDVLYESSAVEPVAAVVRRLLRPGPGSLLLLADPPNRTAANRERFVGLLGPTAGSAALLLQECGVTQCAVNQLDPEMVGGVKGESVAVQFMAFRAAAGNDTIGIKA